MSSYISIPDEDHQATAKLSKAKIRALYRLPLIFPRKSGSLPAPPDLLGNSSSSITSTTATIEGYRDLQELNHTDDKILVIDYGPDNIQCNSVDSIDEVRKPSWSRVRWVHLQTSNVELLERVRRSFGEYHISIKNMQRKHSHRPKMEEFETHFSLVLHIITPGASEMLDFDSIGSVGTAISTIRSFPMIVFVLRDTVLTITSEAEPSVINNILPRLARTHSKLRSSDQGYLLYYLIKLSLTPLRKLLSFHENYLEYLEERLLQKEGISQSFHVGKFDPKKAMILDETVFQEVHLIKRELQQLKRRIAAVHEVIQDVYEVVLSAEDSSVTDSSPHSRKLGPLRFSKQVRLQLKHANNHCQEMASMVLSMQEICNGLGDMVFQFLSQRMNSTMKTLTLISIIFIPLTFLAGIYGTNFDLIPELRWKYGYPMLWATCLLIVIVELVIFKRKNWL